MNVQLKHGVNIDDLHQIMFRAIFACAAIYDEKGYDFVITSAYDGIHMENSLHYRGLAFDIRTRHIPTSFLTLLTDDLRKALSEIDPDFQVILESDHIHVEYDTHKSTWRSN